MPPIYKLVAAVWWLLFAALAGTFGLVAAYAFFGWPGVAVGAFVIVAGVSQMLHRPPPQT